LGGVDGNLKVVRKSGGGGKTRGKVKQKNKRKQKEKKFEKHTSSTEKLTY
jgi:hypothetical protein